MRYQGAFDRLARHFQLQMGEEVDGVMAVAGRTLFEQLPALRPHLNDLPEWMTKEPKGVSPLHDPALGETEFWDSYWWAAVVWAAEKHPELGIVGNRSRVFRCPPLTDRWINYGAWFYLKLPIKCSEFVEHHNWKTVARASHGMCHYLDAALSRQNRGRSVATSRNEPISAPKIEEEYQQITWDGKRCRFKGSTLFRLIAVVAKRPGMHVSFETLFEKAHEGNYVEPSTMRKNLTQIRVQLRECEMGELAAALRSRKRSVFLDINPLFE